MGDEMLQFRDHNDVLSTQRNRMDSTTNKHSIYIVHRLYRDVDERITGYGWGTLLGDSPAQT